MSPCQGCHAGCCRTFVVPVSGADLLRLERDLDIDCTRFIKRWPDPEGTIRQSYAPVFYFADDRQTPYVIALQKVASETWPQSSRCIFLKETPPDSTHPLGQGTCGVYSSRPAACRVFPTKLSLERDLVLISEIEPVAEEEPPIQQLCPRPWDAADIDPLDAPQQIVAAQYEMQFFKLLAKAWNRRPGEWEDFPNFLRLVYSARVKPEAAVDKAAERPASLPMRRAA